MNQWKISGRLVDFPSEWNKDDVLKWINNGGTIRVCPECGKIDVAYDHFNDCDPDEQAVIEINRQ